MKKIACALVLGALSLPAITTSASAGSAIASACVSSSRGAQAPNLCSCIQTVADSMLSPTEQRLGAQIFIEPHKSQQIRASARANGADAAFWAKWQAFGAAAGQYCQ